MSARRWLTMFGCTVVLIVGLYALANILVDPFGVFGDPLLDWYSFNMTNNPRVAKIAYLEKHNDQYDSYIVGCSSANGYSTELLNKYLGARFFNAFAYGCDMYDIGQTARYIIQEYHPKNLVVNLGLTETAGYSARSDDCMNDLHYKVDGSNPFAFYKGFLLRNYRYLAAKPGSARRRGFLRYSTYSCRLLGSTTSALGMWSPLGRCPNTWRRILALADTRSRLPIRHFNISENVSIRFALSKTSVMTRA